MKGYNICELYSIGASKHIKQILTALKGEVDIIIIILGDFNSPL